MLSSPRSLGFVLAAILGAMLVPGCRLESDRAKSSTPDTVSPQFSTSQIPDKYIVVVESSLPDPAASTG